MTDEQKTNHAFARSLSNAGLAAGAVTRAQYRRLLNEQDTGTKHKHNRYAQRTRKYGDYLYHQDRAKFEVDYQEYLAANADMSGCANAEEVSPPR